MVARRDPLLAFVVVVGALVVPDAVKVRHAVEEEILVEGNTTRDRLFRLVKVSSYTSSDNYRITAPGRAVMGGQDESRLR